MASSSSLPLRVLELKGLSALPPPTGASAGAPGSLGASPAGTPKSTPNVPFKALPLPGVALGAPAHAAPTHPLADSAVWAPHNPYTFAALAWSPEERARRAVLYLRRLQFWDDDDSVDEAGPGATDTDDDDDDAAGAAAAAATAGGSDAKKSPAVSGVAAAVKDAEEARMARDLKRLRALVPTYDVLQVLRENHMTLVPFENLNVHRALPYSVDVEDLFHKIVTRRMGGICFEVNILLGWLLAELGFGVRFSVQQFNRSAAIDGFALWTPYTHLGLLVTVSGFNSNPRAPVNASKPHLQLTATAAADKAVDAKSAPAASAADGYENEARPAGSTQWLIDVGMGRNVGRPLEFVLNKPQGTFLDGSTYLVTRADASPFFFPDKAADFRHAIVPPQPSPSLPAATSANATPKASPRPMPDGALPATALSTASGSAPPGSGVAPPVTGSFAKLALSHGLSSHPTSPATGPSPVHVAAAAKPPLPPLHFGAAVGAHAHGAAPPSSGTGSGSNSSHGGPGGSGTVSQATSPAAPAASAQVVVVGPAGHPLGSPKLVTTAPHIVTVGPAAAAAAPAPAAPQLPPLPKLLVPVPYYPESEIRPRFASNAVWYVTHLWVGGAVHNWIPRTQMPFHTQPLEYPRDLVTPLERVLHWASPFRKDVLATHVNDQRMLTLAGLKLLTTPSAAPPPQLNGSGASGVTPRLGYNSVASRANTPRGGSSARRSSLSTGSAGTTPRLPGAAGTGSTGGTAPPTARSERTMANPMEAVEVLRTEYGLDLTTDIELKLNAPLIFNAAPAAASGTASGTGSAAASPVVSAAQAPLAPAMVNGVAGAVSTAAYHDPLAVGWQPPYNLPPAYHAPNPAASPVLSPAPAPTGAVPPPGMSMFVAVAAPGSSPGAAAPAATKYVVHNGSACALSGGNCQSLLAWHPLPPGSAPDQLEQGDGTAAAGVSSSSAAASPAASPAAAAALRMRFTFVAQRADKCVSPLVTPRSYGCGGQESVPAVVVPRAMAPAVAAAAAVAVGGAK